MAKIETTTISLPRSIATRARQLSRAESRTMSELFREAFRVYESFRMHERRSRGEERHVSWKTLRRTLGRIGRAGKRGDLSAFVLRDRLTH